MTRQINWSSGQNYFGNPMDAVNIANAGAGAVSRGVQDLQNILKDRITAQTGRDAKETTANTADVQALYDDSARFGNLRDFHLNKSALDRDTLIGAFGDKIDAGAVRDTGLAQLSQLQDDAYATAKAGALQDVGTSASAKQDATQSFIDSLTAAGMQSGEIDKRLGVVQGDILRAVEHAQDRAHTAKQRAGSITPREQKRHDAGITRLTTDQSMALKPIEKEINSITDALPKWISRGEEGFAKAQSNEGVVGAIQKRADTDSNDVSLVLTGIQNTVNPDTEQKYTRDEAERLLWLGYHTDPHSQWSFLGLAKGFNQSRLEDSITGVKSDYANYENSLNEIAALKSNRDDLVTQHKGEQAQYSESYWGGNNPTTPGATLKSTLDQKLANTGKAPKPEVPKNETAFEKRKRLALGTDTPIATSTHGDNTGSAQVLDSIRKATARKQPTSGRTQTTDIYGDADTAFTQSELRGAVGNAIDTATTFPQIPLKGAYTAVNSTVDAGRDFLNKGIASQKTNVLNQAQLPELSPQPTQEEITAFSDQVIQRILGSADPERMAGQLLYKLPNSPERDLIEQLLQDSL